MKVLRGDVVLCNLNPGFRTEQSGKRPAVVLQVDRANVASPHTIVVPFTTKIRQQLLLSHVLVPAGNGGLTEASVALCEQIRAIDEQRVVRVLGHLDDVYMRGLVRALRTILGL